MVKIIKKNAPGLSNQISEMGESELQILLAKETGKYKFGNERKAKKHPRNKNSD